MTRLLLPDYETVPTMAQFLEGTHNYDMDKHTRLIYHPISGIVYKRRFMLAVDMLDACSGPSCQRIVEVGYGAGLLLRTLSRMADNVIGVDILDTRAVAAVGGMLHKLDINNVRFVSGSVLDLPLRDASADALLCLSMLEHLHPGREMAMAAQEIGRVLRPHGVAILGFPVKNVMTRVLFKILGYDDDVIHPSSHEDILEGFCRRDLQIESVRRFPALLPVNMGLYFVAQLRKS